MNFSRLKKDKSNEKRDTSEEKKPAETEPTTVATYDPVRSVNLFL